MAQIKLIGIPFDGKSSYAGGPRFAPARIREELQSTAYNVYSENLRPVLDTELLLQDGNLEVQSYDDLLPALTNKLSPEDKYLFLGGDHSITFPIVQALHAMHGPFHILHLDAHGDLYDEFEGDRFSHACPFARIMENDLAKSLTQVGIRAITPHQMEQAEKFGVEVFEMKDLAHFEPSWVKGPLYLSIDVDALDPAYAPGVSHREAGGLAPRTVMNWLQEIDVQVIGADIVEYNPLRDIDGITASVCYKLVKEVLDLMLRGKSSSVSL